MQAGLSRAIPMAILGFMFGALLVIVIRGLQGLDPIWASGPGIVISVITTAAFFVWGIGAFDPRLSVHGEEEVEEAVHEELAEEAAEPRSILFGLTWQIVTVLILFMVVLAGFAVLPGGFGLIQTVTPGASTAMVGYTSVPLPFGGPEIEVSTLVIFAVFIIVAFLSLAAAAGAIGYIIVFLSRGVKEAQMAGGGAAALPAPERLEPTPRDQRNAFVATMLFVVVWVVLYGVLFYIIGSILPDRQLPVLSWFMDSHGQLTIVSLVISFVVALIILRPPLISLTFIFTFIILYYFFYYVAIGLILPNPSLPVLTQLNMSNPAQLVMLSFVNAVIFTFVILRPILVLHTVGRVARWLAYVLRHVPHFLQ